MASAARLSTPARVALPTQLKNKGVRSTASARPAPAARKSLQVASVANRPETINVTPQQMTANGNAKLRPVSGAAADSAKALQNLQSLTPVSENSEKKSSIVALGLSVHACPVELRERLAVQDDWSKCIEELTAYPHIEEAAILSTCNRMEVYVVALSFHRGVREVEDWMCKRPADGEVDLEYLRKHMFLLKDEDATAHLLRVSAGLDSLVLGEGQILAQVKGVVEKGEGVSGMGRHLNGLFKAAVTAGKRVRTETKIASGAVSVSSAAAELALMKLPSGSYDDAEILIVGAGTMSRLLVKHLQSKNCKKFKLLNRSLPRAEELAADFPDCEITIGLMDELESSVAAADTIFVASSSDEPIINKAMLEKMPEAPEKVGGIRRLFDISVPRNVDSDVNEMTTARVFNVDDLKEVVEKNKGARAQAAEDAKELLLEEQGSFEAWRDSLETVPTIKRLRQKAEDIRLQALEKTMKQMGDDLTKKQRKAVEDLSRGIVNKLLNGPMQSLRSDGTDARQVQETLVNMHALERMFELSPQEASAHMWTQGSAAPKGKKGRQ